MIRKTRITGLLILAFATISICDNYYIPVTPLGTCQIRPARSKQIGNNLIKTGIIMAGSGILLLGIGQYNVNHTPSEVFPIIGFTAGVVGFSCITISIPITTSGIIVRTVAKRRLRR